MTAQWKAELRGFRSVVEAWESHSRQYPTSVKSNVADRFRQRYTPLLTESLWNKQVKDFIEHNESGVDATKGFAFTGYLLAPPVAIGSPALFPLVIFFLKLRGDSLEVAVRVATFFVDKHAYDAVDVHGWRFDMADPPAAGPKNHSYPHVQRIVSWRPSDPNFYPQGALEPGSTGDQMAGPSINASRPAFPLPCTTPAGVVIAAMTSLYGPETTSKILESVKTKPATLREEMNRVLRYP